jgi:integrase
VHLGYQRWKGEPAGRWVLRRWPRRRTVKNNKGEDAFVTDYSTMTLGLADDAEQADGLRVLSFEQAETKARATLVTRGIRPTRLRVKDAMQRYFDFKRHQGQASKDMEGRNRAHILPELGNLVVADLTAEELRRWLTGMAERPAQRRPKQGKPQYAKPAGTDEEFRARMASANRVLTLLKAALNHAFDEGLVANRDAWGRKLKPFKKVDAARSEYLSLVEALRLINASDSEFRPLVHAGLETGARYGELARLTVADFHTAKQRQVDGSFMEVSTIAIRQSKSGKPRNIVLTPEGAAFFASHCSGRAGSEPMFRHSDGSGWKRSEQARPMREACSNARINPAVGFHQLRHTWASHSVMNGVPLMRVAQNLGHTDTRMVEKHYGHLAPSFVTNAIYAGAPRYGVAEDKKVVPLR